MVKHGDVTQVFLLTGGMSWNKGSGAFFALHAGVRRVTSAAPILAAAPGAENIGNIGTLPRFFC